MTLEIFTILIHIQNFLPVLTVALAFLRFSKRPTYIRVLGYEALGSLISGLGITISYFILHIKGGNNLIGNSFIPADITLWLFVYGNVIQSKRYSRILAYFGVPIVLFSIINLLFIQQLQINSYSLTLLALLLLILSIHYFYQLIQQPPTDKLLSLPFFWINCGVLLYSAVTLILFLFTDYLVNVLKDNLLYYWTFHTVMRIVLVLFISFGVWKELQNHK